MCIFHNLQELQTAAPSKHPEAGLGIKSNTDTCVFQHGFHSCPASRSKISCTAHKLCFTAVQAGQELPVVSPGLRPEASWGAMFFLQCTRSCVFWCCLGLADNKSCPASRGKLGVASVCCNARSPQPNEVVPYDLIGCRWHRGCGQATCSYPDRLATDCLLSSANQM